MTIFCEIVSCGVLNNLAYRNSLPVEVDMEKLDYFTSNIMVLFIMVHLFMLHDFKWTAFLNGPVFIVACYFEARVTSDAVSVCDPNFLTNIHIKRKMFRAFYVYLFMMASQFVQQKEMFVLIIQKKLLVLQQV